MGYTATLLVVISMAFVSGIAEPTDDKITSIPGYPSTFTNRAFGGYL